MIKQCICVADKYGKNNAARYQDKKYGKQLRVHNKIENPNNPNNWRCTVCMHER